MTAGYVANKPTQAVPPRSKFRCSSSYCPLTVPNLFEMETKSRTTKQKRDGGNGCFYVLKGEES